LRITGFGTGVIIQQQDALRLPGTTLLILTGAILVLVRDRARRGA
jgi:hypothetical protein